MWNSLLETWTSILTPHPTSIYTCGVTTAPKVCSGFIRVFLKDHDLWKESARTRLQTILRKIENKLDCYIHSNNNNNNNNCKHYHNWALTSALTLKNYSVHLVFYTFVTYNYMKKDKSYYQFYHKNNDVCDWCYFSDIINNILLMTHLFFFFTRQKFYSNLI